MSFDLPIRIPFDVPHEHVISGRPAQACAHLAALARSKPIRLTHIYYAPDVDIFGLLKLEIVDRRTPPTQHSSVALAPIRWLTPGTITFIARDDDSVKLLERAAFWNEPKDNGDPNA